MDWTVVMSVAAAAILWVIMCKMLFDEGWFRAFIFSIVFIVFLFTIFFLFVHIVGFQGV